MILLSYILCQKKQLPCWLTPSKRAVLKILVRSTDWIWLVGRVPGSHEKPQDVGESNRTNHQPPTNQLAFIYSMMSCTINCQEKSTGESPWVPPVYPPLVTQILHDSTCSTPGRASAVAAWLSFLRSFESNVRCPASTWPQIYIADGRCKWLWIRM